MIPRLSFDRLKSPNFMLAIRLGIEQGNFAFLCEN